MKENSEESDDSINSEEEKNPYDNNIQLSTSQINLKIEPTINDAITLPILLDNIEEPNSSLVENEWERNPFVDTSPYTLLKNPKVVPIEINPSKQINDRIYDLPNKKYPLAKLPEKQKLSCDQTKLKLIDYADLTIIEPPFSYGGFAEVYLGKFKGQEVAIKKLIMKERTLQEMYADYYKEARVLSQLDDHEAIVKYYGSSEHNQDRYLVMEYLPNGTLFSLLNTKGFSDPFWEKRYSIAKDIIDGLIYLHKKTILHRDLKSENVLLDGDNRAKLGDFGLADKLSKTPSSKYSSAVMSGGYSIKCMLSENKLPTEAELQMQRKQAPILIKLCDDKHEISFHVYGISRKGKLRFRKLDNLTHLNNLNPYFKGNAEINISEYQEPEIFKEIASKKAHYKQVVAGTSGFMAPEIIRNPKHSQYSKKSDIYAYGMVLWEMATQKKPFSTYCDRSILENLITKKGLRETIPAEINGTPYGKMISDCWKDNPDERPTTEELKEILTYLKKENISNIKKIDLKLPSKPEIDLSVLKQPQENSKVSTFEKKVMPRKRQLVTQQNDLSKSPKLGIFHQFKTPEQQLLKERDPDNFQNFSDKKQQVVMSSNSGKNSGSSAESVGSFDGYAEGKFSKNPINKGFPQDFHHGYPEQNIKNSAVTFFLSEKALNFQNWYHPEICHYLLQMADNKAKCIRVIFHDANEGNNTQTFKNQLLQLVMLSQWLKRPALFVSKEPGADNHFICGLVKEGNLLLINPLGITTHKICYQTLTELKREKTIKEVWLSSNSLQKRLYEEEGLVSCGPIALELTVHILSNFTPERLDNFWAEHLKTDGHTTHDASGLTYYGINIQSLLPNTLKELMKATDESHYQSQICVIRQKHCGQLQALPVEHAENLHTSVEIYLLSCKEGGPHQLVFNALVMEKTLNDINELPAYQLLKQEIDTQAIKSTFSQKAETVFNENSEILSQKDTVIFEKNPKINKIDPQILLKSRKRENQKILINHFSTQQEFLESIQAIDQEIERLSLEIIQSQYLEDYVSYFKAKKDTILNNKKRMIEHNSKKINEKSSPLINTINGLFLDIQKKKLELEIKDSSKEIIEIQEKKLSLITAIKKDEDELSKLKEYTPDLEKVFLSAQSELEEHSGNKNQVSLEERKYVSPDELIKANTFLIDILKNPISFDYKDPDVQSYIKLTIDESMLRSLLIYSVKNNNKDLFRLVCLRVKNKSIQNEKNRSLLELSAQHGNNTILKELLTFGVIPNIEVLSYCAFNNRKAFILLLEKFVTQKQIEKAMTILSKIVEYCSNDICMALLRKIELVNTCIYNNVSESLLELSTKRDDLDVLKELLNFNIEPDIGSLHYCVLTNKQEAFRLLLDSCTSQEKVKKIIGDFYKSKTILYLAAETGNNSICIDILDKIKRYPEIEISNGCNYSGRNVTPLEIALQNGHINIARLLEKNGCTGDYISFLAFNAIKTRDIKAFKKILAKGLRKNSFNVNVTDGYGYTFLHKALMSGCGDIFKYLLEIPDINVNAKLHGHLYISFEHNGYSFEVDVRKFYHNYDKVYFFHINLLDFVSSIIIRFNSISQEYVKTIIDNLIEKCERDKIDLNVHDVFSGDPLWKGWSIFLRDNIRDIKIDIFKFVLSKIRDRNISIDIDFFGATILYYAAENNREDICKFLIDEYKANPNKKCTRNQYLPIDIAFEKGYKPIVDFLKKNGSVPINSASLLPLVFEFVKKGQLDKLKSLTTQEIRSIINLTHDYSTLLVKAVEFNHKDIYAYLIENGADIKICPLYIAIIYSNAEMCDFIFDPKHKNYPNFYGYNNYLFTAVSRGISNIDVTLRICHTLIEAGCPLDIQDKATQKTALYLAAENGWDKICQILVNAGANQDLGVINAEGHVTKPLNIAIENNHYKVVEIFLKLNSVQNTFVPKR